MQYNTNYTNKIPIYTTGNVGTPSVPFQPNTGTTFISAYSGNILNGHPTFTTKTDDSSGKNPYYHGGIAIGNNKVVCHYKK